MATQAKAATKTMTKAEEKARKKARDKAQQKAAQEAKREARQKVLHYDAEGNRIGDDGYIMTKARNRLHQLCNGYFILMIVSFLSAVAMIVAAFFQGQQLTEWELVAYGGNQFNGMSIASLLRIEALFLLFITAASLFANMKGMAWLYDGAAKKPVTVVMLVMAIPSVVFTAVAAIVVGVPEPFSLVVIAMSVLLWKFMQDVEAERGSLKHAKVAKTVVK